MEFVEQFANVDRLFEEGLITVVEYRIEVCDIVTKAQTAALSWKRRFDSIVEG